MSEHFRLDDVVRTPVSRRERRRLRRMFAPAPRRSSTTTVAILIAAAVCAGLAAGLGGRDVRTAAASPSINSAIPFFGFCHVGGGRNCVVDGDTFYHGAAKIRIANIDAPETHPPRCAAEARLGKAATDRLRDLLNAGDIRLSSIDRDEDIYGRKLRTVAVGGADVGETLVGEGLARTYRGGRQPWC